MSTTTSRASCQAARERLAAADAHLGASWRTLAPGDTDARPLLAIGGALFEEDPDRAVDASLAEAFANGLASIAVAMRRAFPHNVFGDLDGLAASLWRQAAQAPEGVAFMREQCDRVVELQRLFGCSTAIHFRYAHDFLYGFDWAKWVAQEPSTRSTVGPFSPGFLEYMDGRGHELLRLIAVGNDVCYPPLPDRGARNAFGFSREPADEITLHQHLAREGLLPVEAWSIHARPRWDLPFARLRRERARDLGLSLAGSDPSPSV